jgi:hypothetical protein
MHDHVGAERDSPPHALGSGQVAFMASRRRHDVSVRLELGDQRTPEEPVSPSHQDPHKPSPSGSLLYSARADTNVSNAFRVFTECRKMKPRVRTIA